jgi:hypothetical protein
LDFFRIRWLWFGSVGLDGIQVWVCLDGIQVLVGLDGIQVWLAWMESECWFSYLRRLWFHLDK